VNLVQMMKMQTKKVLRINQAMRADDWLMMMMIMMMMMMMMMQQAFDFHGRCESS
jgi:tripartite-type tricarboxylate transporter receptor subunit TctC